MTDDGAQAPATLAQDVFDISLRPRPGGRPRHALRLAGAFAAQLLQQLVPSPSVHDVVVTRRDLATLDPDPFLAQWRPPARR